MTFGERLLMYMENAGLSQKQLAEMIDVTPTRLNYWVKDKREPDVFYIKALAKALDVSGDALLGTDDVVSEHNANLDFTSEEIALLSALRALDAPGKAAVKAVLESEQQRIKEYGPAVKRSTVKLPDRIPLIQGTHEAEIQMSYQAKWEQRELQQSLALNSESLQSDPT